MKYRGYYNYARGLASLGYAGYKAWSSRGNQRKAASVGNRFRHKLRGQGSRTKTKRRRRSRRKVRQSIFEGHSKVWIPTKARKTRLSKMFKSIALKDKYITNQTGRISGAVGQLGVSYITHYNNATLSNIVGHLTTNATQSLFLHKMSCELMLQNQENNDCLVWIYTLVLRNDTGSVGLNPPQDWQQGLVDETGASTDYLLPHGTPFQSKKFTTRWKVHTVQKFTLSSGAIHNHHINCYPMHKINKERFTSTGGTGTGGATNGVAYLTSCTMIVTLGALVNDSAVKTNVTYGESNVDFAAVWRYQSMGCTDDSTLYSRAYTLPTVVVGNQSVMNEKVGSAVISSAA